MSSIPVRDGAGGAGAALAGGSGGTFDDPVERLLVETGKREVGGREPTRLWREAVVDQGAERGAVRVGEPLDGLPVVDVPRVGECQAQRPRLDATGHLEQVRSHAAGGDLGAARLGRRGEEALAVARVEAAGVVEADLRLRQPRELIRPRIGREVAQHAVADAAARNRAERLLDRPQARPWIVGLGELEPYGEDAREPPDRAAQVDVGEERLAAVSFDVDPHGARAAPAVDGL